MIPIEILVTLWFYLVVSALSVPINIVAEKPAHAVSATFFTAWFAYLLFGVL